MKRLCFVLIFIFLFAACVFAKTYPVLRVIDGDTIVVLYRGKKERVRLLCVDTSESCHPDKRRNTAFGELTAKYVKSKLSGKNVKLSFERKWRRDRFSRLLAYVFIEKENFNIELVRLGYSPYYKKYGKSKRHHAKFVAAEKQARQNQKGIWALQ